MAISVINTDNIEKLFKKCTLDNPNVEIVSDTVIIIGNGEFEILFVE